MTFRFPSARGKRHRRGMILPIVLVGLLVVALIAAAMANTVLLQRRSARRAERVQQSMWLADSALLRAKAKLAADADYGGETWTISADQLQARHGATAIIRVEPTDDGQLIVIEATYPEHPVHRILQRRELHVELTSPGGSS